MKRIIFILVRKTIHVTYRGIEGETGERKRERERERERWRDREIER